MPPPYMTPFGVQKKRITDLGPPRNPRGPCPPPPPLRKPLPVPSSPSRPGGPSPGSLRSVYRSVALETVWNLIKYSSGKDSVLRFGAGEKICVQSMTKNRSVYEVYEQPEAYFMIWWVGVKCL